MNNNNRKNRSNQDGVTLIEILLAMMIFGFIIGGITLFGVRSMEAHTKSQAMQNSLENARFGIESLSKKARTSSGMTGNASEVFFIDNASGIRYCYYFDSGNNALMVKIGTGSETNCLGITSSPEAVIGDAGSNSNILVDGFFNVKESSASERGLLRINMKVTYNGFVGVQGINSETIQTTVSLRDY